MKLRTIGYYKEMPHGQETDPCMEEFINQEDPEQAEMICNYLRNGSALIVSPGETIDVLHPEKGFSGTATAYTDGTWVWPGDLAYYVESYLLRVPEDFRQTMIQNKWHNPVADLDFTNEAIEINGIQMF